MRRFWVKVHRYTGLSAAVFLVVMGLTGSALAFENDYDRWLNPSLWRGQPGPAANDGSHDPAPLGEQALVTLVERQFGGSAGTRVAQIDIAGGDVAHVFLLSNGLRIYVNPYTGQVNGTRESATKLERLLLEIRVAHTRLLVGERGRLVVDWVSAVVVVLLVPIGACLWWNTRRSTVTWSASWKRINWDLHSVVGIYAAAFIVVLAGTGFLLGYEAPLYWLTRSTPEASPRLPRSTIPADSATEQRRDLDAILAAADSALPDRRAYQVLLPMRARSVFQVVKHASGGGKSLVALDQYSGRVLLVDDFARDSRALRAHTLDQALHLGTIGGFGTKLIAFTSGIALIVMVMTGTVMWWRKG